jgi:hypothetical protein
MHHSLIILLALVTGPPGGEEGPFVRALWLLQRYGTAEAADPANDERVKGVLAKALGKEGELAISELAGLMEPDTFKKLAGTDDRIGADDVMRAIYDDPANPQQGFAALLVCSEADAACPTVKGADLRVSMPYLDPKIYDGGAYEAAKYAERRDDMGRLMLSVMLQVRHRLAKSKQQ